MLQIKRKKKSQYIKRGVPWILVCHPQGMKIYKCSTGINCNYIYKRCHHLSNMSVFNLQHIFNHILQSNLEQEHLSQKTKKESSLKRIYGAWWCSVMIGTIIFPPFGRLEGKSLCNYTKNMSHNMCTSSGVKFHCYHSASAMHSHYNIKTKEYYKNNILNKSQHYYGITCSSSSIAPLNSAPRNISFNSSSVTYGSLIQIYITNVKQWQKVCQKTFQ